MSGGCGETSWTETEYYNPNWMPDGRIICSKLEMKFSKSIFGVKQQDYSKVYITALTINDSNEVIAEANLFEAPDVKSEIVCSPVGEKIGYIAGSSFELAICNYDGSGKYKIPGVSGVRYFDWSPNAEKLAYTNSSRELHVVNIDGTSDKQIASSAEAVAWRVGEKIIYEGIVNGLYSYIFSVNSDGSDINQVVSGSDPQKINENQIIYSGTDNVVKSIYLTGTGESTKSNTFNRSTIKLSFDNTKIVGAGDIYGKGIYIINVDGSGEKRLR